MDESRRRWPCLLVSSVQFGCDSMQMQRPKPLCYRAEPGHYTIELALVSACVWLDIAGSATKRFYCLLACGCMVHDRLRIVDPRMIVPVRLMDLCCTEALEFWHEAANVVTIGIEAAALAKWVKDAEVRGRIRPG